MPYRIDAMIATTKFTFYLFGVGGLWFAQTMVDSANWVEKWGIFGAIIAALVTVIKLQHAENKQARLDALLAKDALILAAKETATMHHETSKELLIATYNQTAELVKFNERLIAIDGLVRQCPNAKPTAAK